MKATDDDKLCNIAVMLIQVFVKAQQNNKIKTTKKENNVSSIDNSSDLMIQESMMGIVDEL
jgi:hypothetical protein